MKKWCVRLSVLSLFLLGVSSDLSACGDKFLVAGRGVQNQRTFGALMPASILIFSNNQNPGESPTKTGELAVIFESAGHTFDVAETTADLDAKLGSTEVDVVVSSFADSHLVQKSLEDTGSQASILPVVAKAEKDNMAAAKQQYKRVLKAPSRAGRPPTKKRNARPRTTARPLASVIRF